MYKSEPFLSLAFAKYFIHPLLIAIFQNFTCSKIIAIFAIVMVCDNNSTRNEEFLVKTLEDQQKIYVVFMRLISTLGALDHCAIWKYINQN
jgi:hypothetical protein